MIRALLAVVLAAALLAASLPAVESATADRTAASLDREIDRLERAGHSLLVDDDPGARRIVSVSLPAASLAAVGVDSFAVSCDQRCLVRFVLSSGASRSRRLDLPLATPGGTVRLGSPREHRLTLRLRDGDDGRVVTVQG